MDRESTAYRHPSADASALPQLRRCVIFENAELRAGEPAGHNPGDVAGTAAIGTKYLARQDAKVMAFIGTGWQAQAEVLCNAAVRKLDKIKVYSPTPGHSQAFAERWTEEAGVEIVPVRSAQEAVKGALTWSSPRPTRPNRSSLPNGWSPASSLLA